MLAYMKTMFYQFNIETLCELDDKLICIVYTMHINFTDLKITASYQRSYFKDNQKLTSSKPVVYCSEKSCAPSS